MTGDAVEDCVRREDGVVVVGARGSRSGQGGVVDLTRFCALAANTEILLDGSRDQLLHRWVSCTEGRGMQRRVLSGQIKEVRRIQLATCVALIVLVSFAAWCVELLLEPPLERFSRGVSGSNAFRCRQY